MINIFTLLLIYVVTYFYLLDLYNILWPAAVNDPRNLPFDAFSLKWLQISLGWFSKNWLDIHLAYKTMYI